MILLLKINRNQPLHGILKGMGLMRVTTPSQKKYLPVMKIKKHVLPMNVLLVTKKKSVLLKNLPMEVQKENVKSQNVNLVKRKRVPLKKYQYIGTNKNRETPPAITLPFTLNYVK